MRRRWWCAAILLTLLTAGVALPAAVTANPSFSGLSALARILEGGGKWTIRDRDSVRWLLRRGGESVRTRSPRGVTVLMFAANTGDLGMMRAALKGGVDVNARTREGLTALWYVMSSLDEDKLGLLLDAGADVEAADTEGRTPLMRATHCKFRAGIDLLLARGARVNAANMKGYTALAYTDGHPGITRLLRQNGAVE